MKKAIAASLVLLSLAGLSIWNRKVRIPGSTIYVRARLFAKPRLWGNAVEFDYIGWQEICYSPDGPRPQRGGERA